jgi:hypothetical protein
MLALLVGRTAATADELRWPAYGIMDTAEGTFECWIRFAFDPQAFRDVRDSAKSQGQGGLFFFDYSDPLYPYDGWSVKLLAGWAGPAAARVGRAVNGQDAPLPGYISFGPDARRGEWYHFALVWAHGRKSVVYVNGSPVGESPVAHGGDKPPLPGATFAFAGGNLAVDDVRLSCVGRKPEDLGCGAAGTVRDAATVWLMTFGEAAATNRQVAADYSATAAAGVPQGLPGSFSLMPGKTGSGLALCDPSAFK